MQNDKIEKSQLEKIILVEVPTKIYGDLRKIFVSLFENSGTGYVKFGGTYGVVIPSGNTSARGSVATGMIRYNTEDERVELYDGTSWVSVAGSAGGVNFSLAKELAVEMALIVG